MKNTLINLLAKLAGAGKALEFLSGKKSYVAGAGLVLLGAGQVLVELVPVIASKDTAALLAFASSLAAHAGVKMILEGIGVLGLRHAVAKASEPAPAAAPEAK